MAYTFAVILVILYVLQSQVDVLLAPSSTNRTLKLALLVLAILLMALRYFGR